CASFSGKYNRSTFISDEVVNKSCLSGKRFNVESTDCCHSFFFSESEYLSLIEILHPFFSQNIIIALITILNYFLYLSNTYFKAKIQIAYGSKEVFNIGFKTKSKKCT